MKSSIRRLLSPRIKSHRILAGPLRGARIVTSWRDYPASITGRTERELLNWFHGHVSPGETWLDVGAHYGYTAIALAQLVGSSGRVFAFEPVTSTAGCVAQARTLNRLAQLTVVPCGLGAPETLQYLQLPLQRGMADSTVTAQQGGWHESIQVAQFDWLWPLLNGGLEKIHGVKIDVQGMEIDVIRGMEKTLKQHQPKLIVEFHSGVSRSTLLDLLVQVGYDPVAEPIDHQGGTDLKDDRSYAFGLTSAGHK